MMPFCKVPTQVYICLIEVPQGRPAFLCQHCLRQFLVPFHWKILESTENFWRSTKVKTNGNGDHGPRYPFVILGLPPPFEHTKYHTKIDFTCNLPSNVLCIVTHLLGWAPFVVMAVIKLSSSSLFSFSFFTRLSMARLPKLSDSPPCLWHMRLCTMLRHASADVGALVAMMATLTRLIGVTSEEIGK